MIGLSYGNFQAVTTAPFSFGNALQFDGVNDFVSVPQTTSLNSANFTWSLWVKPNSSISAGSGRQSVIRQLNGTFIEFDQAGLGRLSFLFYEDGTNFERIYTSQTSWSNQWYHVVVTYNGSVQSIYIDGVLSNSNSVATTVNIPNVITYFGQSGFGSLYSNITLDETAFWNVAATSQNVTDLYNNGNGRLASSVISNPVAYWRMNGSGTDTTAIDETGNHNGTLNNFPTSGMWVAH